jgi:hypothetical protein
MKTDYKKSEPVLSWTSLMEAAQSIADIEKRRGLEPENAHPDLDGVDTDSGTQPDVEDGSRGPSQETEAAKVNFSRNRLSVRATNLESLQVSDKPGQHSILAKSHISIAGKQDSRATVVSLPSHKRGE